jgi:hypothetical protein
MWAVPVSPIIKIRRSSSCFADIHQIFEQHVCGLYETFPNSRNLEINGDFTLALLKFAEQNHQLFKALLKQQDLAEFVNGSLFDYLNEPLKRWMSREKSNSIPSEIITQYIVSAFFGIFKWWISKDMPCTAENLDKYFRQLTTPIVNNIIPAN